MRKAHFISLALITLLTPYLANTVHAQETKALRLVQTIPMPNVKGRIDHMDVDLEGKRLFVAAIENGSMEVLDLAAGKWVRTIPGFKTPTEMIYVRELNKLFVASRDDGMIRVFRGDSLDLIDSIKLELGPNRMVYDAARKYIYVGYGAKLAGFDYGRVGTIDARSDKLLGDMIVESHPSQILLDNSANRVLVSVWEQGRIDVFDSIDHHLLLTWTTGGQSGDMALDHAHHRLFIATRNAPQTLIVYDSDSGQEISRLPAEGRMNGVYYDGWHQRIYVTCGRDLPAGFAFVYQQKDADHYDFIGKVATAPGAGTSFWVPQTNRFYVAIPGLDKQEGAILVFEPQP
jgi:DNA-binding beta-propeller fold protein YncE